MARLYVLGGNGWVPSPKRSTNCYALETRRSLILFDCGVGVSRLSDPMMRLVLERVPRVIVLLSHYHHDHIEGLHMLPHFLRDHEVTIAGPGVLVSGFDCAAVLARFGSSPLLPQPITAWGETFRKGFSIVELREGRNKIAGETIEVVRQPHSDPSVGFRVRDVAYVTDTVVRAETAAFAKGASVLVHDAWLDADDEALGHADLRRHGTAHGAAAIAKEAGVSELVLGHLNPSYDEPRLERMLISACDVFPNTRLANDFTVVEVRSKDDEDLPGGAAPEGPIATETGGL